MKINPTHSVDVGDENIGGGGGRVTTKPLRLLSNMEYVHPFFLGGGTHICIQYSYVPRYIPPSLFFWSFKVPIEQQYGEKQPNSADFGYENMGGGELTAKPLRL